LEKLIAAARVFRGVPLGSSRMITLCLPANNGQASQPTDPESWGRNWSRKVRETHSSSSQKRSERGEGVLAARRTGYPWPEQMSRKMLRNVEKRGVQTDKTPRARAEVLAAP